MFVLVLLFLSVLNLKKVHFIGKQYIFYFKWNRKKLIFFFSALIANMSNNMSHLKAVVGAKQCNCIWTVLSNLAGFA